MLFCFFNIHQSSCNSFYILSTPILHNKRQHAFECRGKKTLKKMQKKVLNIPLEYNYHLSVPRKKKKKKIVTTAGKMIEQGAREREKEQVI